jgi:hypothetical protein
MTLRIAFAIGTLAGRCVVAGEIYSGEPLGEALHDLSAANAVIVADDLVTASLLLRTDVFRFPDGRLVAITSSAQKAGEPYSIKTLQATSSSGQKLSSHLPTVASVQFADHQ